MILIIYNYIHTPRICANYVPDIVRNIPQYWEMMKIEKFVTA
jgi:hypothetical protein